MTTYSNPTASLTIKRRMHDPEYRALYEQREAARPAVDAARPAMLELLDQDWVLDIVAERLAVFENAGQESAQAWLQARADFDAAAAPSRAWIESHPEYR